MKMPIHVIGWPEGTDINTLKGLLENRVSCLGTCSKPWYFDIIDMTENDVMKLGKIEGLSLDPTKGGGSMKLRVEYPEKKGLPDLRDIFQGMSVTPCDTSYRPDFVSIPHLGEKKFSRFEEVLETEGFVVEII